MAKRARGKQPDVFAVPSDESSKAGYHEVLWAKDGNLNAAVRRHNIKYFRKWPLAKEFAHTKAKELGCKATIHPY